MNATLSIPALMAITPSELQKMGPDEMIQAFECVTSTLTLRRRVCDERSLPVQEAIQASSIIRDHMISLLRA
jgi:hypothetical protein